jgi:hypothetical protein
MLLLITYNKYNRYYLFNNNKIRFLLLRIWKQESRIAPYIWGIFCLKDDDRNNNLHAQYGHIHNAQLHHDSRRWYKDHIEHMSL